MRIWLCAMIALAGLGGCHKADDYDSRFDKVAGDIEARQKAIEQEIASTSSDRPSATEQPN